MISGSSHQRNQNPAPDTAFMIINLTRIIKQGMKTTPEHNERVAKMTFASVYPLYITKVEKKGRTKEELHQVIEWLTGFDGNKT